MILENVGKRMLGVGGKGEERNQPNIMKEFKKELKKVLIFVTLNLSCQKKGGFETGTCHNFG